MDASLLDKIVANIHRRYPEFASSRPSVRLQQAPHSEAARSEPTYLLTFHRKVQAGAGPQQKQMPRWMRVVVSQKGKIIKVTTSR